MYIKDMKSILQYSELSAHTNHVFNFISQLKDYTMEPVGCSVNLTQTDKLVSIPGPLVSVLCGEYPHRVRGRGAGVLHDLMDTRHDDLRLQNVPYKVKVNPLQPATNFVSILLPLLWRSRMDKKSFGLQRCTQQILLHTCLKFDCFIYMHNVV